jgi:hypothetical protein
MPAMLYLNGQDFKGNLDEIISNDSNGYNPAIMKAKEYFIKIQENKEEGEMKDTTRELKTETQTAAENENKILQLKENEIKAKAKADSKDNNNELTVKRNNFIIEEGSGNNKQNEQLPKVSSTNKKIISYEDYNCLKPEDLIYDKRGYITILKETLKIEHSLLSLFFKKSFFEPPFLMLIKFTFEINTQFAFNALLFTDSYIEKRLDYPHMVK